MHLHVTGAETGPEESCLGGPRGGLRGARGVQRQVWLGLAPSAQWARQRGEWSPGAGSPLETQLPSPGTAASPPPGT